jgi:hypothetical protein
MPTVSEALNSKPPLGAVLAAGVRSLSADQQISFSLHRRYVFPLDGMNYWVRVPSSVGNVTTAGIVPTPGLASATLTDGEAIQVSPGGILGKRIAGGTIINPLLASDQGLLATEPLFVDFTGPAYCSETETTSELVPGKSILIPEHCSTGAWVCSKTGGHKFTVVLERTSQSVTLPTDVIVEGSLHYTSEVEQREDATVDSNNIVFTSLTEIQPFNALGPNYLYIAHYLDLTFAFKARGRVYEQADLYHYAGTALFSTNVTQIIEDFNTFNPTLVVSNSLPIWLYMSGYVPPYPGFTCPFRLYPSYLVDDNLVPPFGSVHIEDSIPLAQVPILGRTLEATQLCRDKVLVHVYGANNQMISDFREFVNQYSRDWNTIGMAMSGAIVDHKHTQSEFQILSQRKSIRFSVNYLQSVSRNVARQFIEHVKVQYYPQTGSIE